jgi:hypothetical protein
MGARWYGPFEERLLAMFRRLFVFFQAFLLICRKRAAMAGLGLLRMGYWVSGRVYMANGSVAEADIKV